MMWISGFVSPAGCPMSQWSVWSQCSCESQKQQRYRVALSPATRGQQCTPVETQSRACRLSQCDGEFKTMLSTGCNQVNIVHSVFCSIMFFSCVRLQSPVCVLSLWCSLWEAVCPAGPSGSVFGRQGVYTWLLLPRGKYDMSPGLFCMRS